MKIKLIISIIFLSLCFSQEETKINHIKVDGNTRLSDDDIIRISNIYPGMTIVSGDEIQRGVKQLWELNRFNDIQIILDNENKHGIDIIIQVEEADYLDQISINGNKKINKNKINEILELESGQLITEKNIFESKNRLISKYKDRGYYNVSIEDSIYQSNLDFASNIKFTIYEGKKIKLKNIIFNGNTTTSSKRIKRLMKNNKEWKWYMPWRGSWKKDLFQTARQWPGSFRVS